ncbi:MAG: hypothetical protein NZ480_04900 [Bdellovibrionaceae bacterium]|nr:hypothetical protein [Pseudobdellovibrionaceae bacterium]MDW8191110.1 hypothetical protein [Pseudobdellovibrionaceae bacterium]
MGRALAEQWSRKEGTLQQLKGVNEQLAPLKPEHDRLLLIKVKAEEELSRVQTEWDQLQQ